MGRLVWGIFWVLTGYVHTSAQTVNANQPQPGQRLSYVSYTENGKLDLEADGKDVSWDFSYLQAPYQREVSIEPARSGRYSSKYPTADLVLKEVNGYEIYLQQSNNNLIEVGRTGGFWLLEKSDEFISYAVKPIIKKAGVAYGQSYSDRSSFSIHLGKGDFNSLSSINIPIAFDSIRYDVSLIDEVTADGTGQLILPLSMYNTIRLRHEIELTITPHVKSKLGWRPYIENNDPDLPETIPTGIFHFVKYGYWTESESLPVMTVNVINGAFTVKYLISDSSVPKVKVYNQSKDVLAFPNPTYGDIEFQLINLETGIYTLEIDNIFGQSLHRERFNVNHTRKIKTDLSFLSRGTYLYSIVDSKGNKITTKRVVIITP